MPRTDRMSTQDAEFYFAEHGNVPMHIGSVAVFDGPAPAHQDVMRLFEAKLPSVPRYRQVVRTTPGQILRPVWADDEDFTISHHVRHATIPAPGGPDQLRAAAAKLFALRLDRRSWIPVPPPSFAELAAGDLRDAVSRPLRQLAAAPALVRRARTEDVLDYTRGLAATARRLAEPSAIFLNGPIGPARRWTWTTASLAELKQVRAARGGTINDIVLAAITRAFRDLLTERHELTEGLVVRSAVPVSVRGPDEAGVITNRVSAVLANLPAGEPDPLRRLSLIRQQMDDAKHTHQAVSAEILTGMLGFAGPAWLALGTQAAFRIRQPLVQTVTTNVPGPRRPLYVLGRPMTALYPYVPIGNAVRISVAIVSYVDAVSFGVTADHDAVPDLDVFVRGIRLGLDELKPDK